ncbi:hypothetical protein [Xanthobacter sediminis]
MASNPLRSASILANTLIQDLASNPDLAEALKAEGGTIQSRATEAIRETDAETKRVVNQAGLKIDMDIYRLVVGALGASVILAMISILIISIVTLMRLDGGVAGAQIAIPDGLVALASASVGALAGLLTPLGRSV